MPGLSRSQLTSSTAPCPFGPHVHLAWRRNTQRGWKLDFHHPNQGWENPTTAAVLGGQPTTCSQGWWGESNDAFEPLKFLISDSSRASKDCFKQILSSNKPGSTCQASYGHCAVSRNASHLMYNLVLIGLQVIIRVQVLG